ncbi:hypothetical protein HEQ63_07875 [Haematospirillum jordaniae]|uniref:phage tail terminator protein n=1 Tax=Haematospirillum jordaniae TaxID=1549855 RepID=UPI001432F759|nr:hypothetical protein [Haematospirillum jordaniae]NKD86100.1 hypothetical protein [Haematospirillum jordaniae]
MLDAIIQALRERCHTFSGASGSARIAGAAEFARVAEDASLPVPAAYVLPREEKPATAVTCTGYRQPVQAHFAVVVVLPAADRRGQGAAVAVESVRDDLFRALLGWEPPGYGPIVYEGGELLSVDRARLWWQFTFSAAYQITEDETWLAVTHRDRPLLETVRIGLDATANDPETEPCGKPDGYPERWLQLHFDASAQDARENQK